MRKGVKKKWFAVSVVIFTLVSGLAGYLLLTENGLSHSENTKDYNVVFITVDALRYDRLGAYGYDRNTSPNIDRLAKNSAVFTNTTSSSGSTLFSMASTFTSLYPFADNVVKPRWSWKTNQSLVRKFNQKGYNTQAVVATPFVKSDYKFDSHFDRFNDNFTVGKTPCNTSSSASNFRKIKDCFSRRDASETTAIGKDMLKTEEPFFLWLHYFDTHDPYMPPKRRYLKEFRTPYEGGNGTQNYSYRAEQRELSNRKVHRINNQYDAEVRYADYYIGKLIEDLKHRGVYDNTVIVLTADHGECLGEHNHIGHNKLYECSLRVPLIMHIPDRGHQKIEKPVSTIDVFPTLLELIGETPERFTRGENLFSQDHRNYQYAERPGESLLFDYGLNMSSQEINDSYRTNESDSARVSRKLRKRLRELGYTEETLTAK